MYQATHAVVNGVAAWYSPVCWDLVNWSHKDVRVEVGPGSAYAKLSRPDAVALNSCEAGACYAWPFVRLDTRASVHTSA